MCSASAAQAWISHFKVEAYGSEKGSLSVDDITSILKIHGMEDNSSSKLLQPQGAGASIVLLYSGARAWLPLSKMFTVFPVQIARCRCKSQVL